MRFYSWMHPILSLDVISLAVYTADSAGLSKHSRGANATNVLGAIVELGIILQYIPPYSPNLNPGERLWRFVKKELRSKYYDDFTAFQKKIDSVIVSTTKEKLPTDNTMECLAKGQKGTA